MRACGRGRAAQNKGLNPELRDQYAHLSISSCWLMECVYSVRSFWKFVSKLDRRETRRYLQMFYTLMMRPLIAKVTYHGLQLAHHLAGLLGAHNSACLQALHCSPASPHVTDKNGICQALVPYTRCTFEELMSERVSVADNQGLRAEVRCLWRQTSPWMRRSGRMKHGRLQAKAVARLRRTREQPHMSGALRRQQECDSM